MPDKFVHFVQIVNPWSHHTICFEPTLELALCLSSSPTLASGPSVWITFHNLWFKPITLHAGHQVGIVEATEEASTSSTPMSMGGLVPSHLSLVQQCQLTQLLEQLWNILSQDDKNTGQTPVLEHTIETQGPPVWLPYHRRNPTVQQEEAKQVQQMLDSGIIRQSSSPWASPVVMVSKKDGNLCLCRLLAVQFCHGHKHTPLAPH